MSGRGGVAMAESPLSCSHQTGHKRGFINTLTYNFPFFLFKVGKFHTFLAALCEVCYYQLIYESVVWYINPGLCDQMEIFYMVKLSAVSFVSFIERNYSQNMSVVSYSYTQWIIHMISSYAHHKHDINISFFYITVNVSIGISWHPYSWAPFNTHSLEMLPDSWFFLETPWQQLLVWTMFVQHNCQNTY